MPKVTSKKVADVVEDGPGDGDFSDDAINGADIIGAATDRVRPSVHDKEAKRNASVYKTKSSNNSRASNGNGNVFRKGCDSNACLVKSDLYYNGW